MHRMLEGDQLRILNTSCTHALGFALEINLNDGTAKTVDWYQAHADAGLLGMGNSQKAEVAYLDLMGYEYTEKDVATYEKRTRVWLPRAVMRT